MQIEFIKGKCPACGWQNKIQPVALNFLSENEPPVCPECLCCIIIEEIGVKNERNRNYG